MAGLPSYLGLRSRLLAQHRLYQEPYALARTKARVVGLGAYPGGGLERLGMGGGELRLAFPFGPLKTWFRGMGPGSVLRTWRWGLDNQG